jgi:hypothetical protein
MFLYVCSLVLCHTAAFCNCNPWFMTGSTAQPFGEEVVMKIQATPFLALGNT